MQFRKASAWHGVSLCGKFVICRSGNGAGGAYTAVQNGRPDRLLGSFRYEDESGREAAWHEAVAVCEAAANG